MKFGRSVPEARFLRGNRPIAIGTSLLNHAHGTVQVGGAVQQIFAAGRSWLHWLEVFSFGALRFPVWPDSTVYPGWEPSGTPGTTRGFFGANMGVSGQYASQITDRIQGTPTVLKKISSYPFTIAFVDQGTNDVAGATTAAAIVAERQLATGKLLGIAERVCVLPIRIRSTASWTAAQSQKAAYANAMLRDWCQKNPRLLWLDWNRPLVDGTSATGAPRTGYLDDGIHDAPAGGMAIAWWMWHGQIWNGTSFVDDWPGLKTMFALTPGSAIDSAINIYSADNPRGNLHPNGKMLSNTGSVSQGVTGEAPTSVTMQRSSGSGSTTGVGSTGPRADGRSRQAILTLTPGGSADETFYIRTNPSTIDVSALANQWLVSSVDVDVAAYAGYTEVSCYCSAAAEPITAIGGKIYFDGSVNWPLAAFPWSGRLRTPFFKLGAAPTTLAQRVNVGIRGNVAGSPVVKVSNFDTVIVDDPTSVLLAA